MNHYESPTFQMLFREHYAPVLRKLMHLVGELSVAEDLAQEVFLKLYRNPPDDLDKAAGWLNRVAITTAYDYLRGTMRRKALEEKEQNRQMTLGEVAYPSNEELMLANWEKELVKKALNKLSDRDREALLLKQQGFSYAEIADVLQVKPALVGTILIRATERFRKVYMTEEGPLQ